MTKKNAAPKKDAKPETPSRPKGRDLQWVTGASLTTLLFIIGTCIAAFRSLAARISRCTGELHGRIDEVKDKYVRRDDLDNHLRRLDESIVELRREVRDGQIKVIEAIRTSKP